MSILYISHDFSDIKIGGNIGKKQHYDVLKELYSNNFYCFFIKHNKNKINILKNYLTLSFNGQTKEINNNIFKIIKEKKIKKIILDSSTLGNLAKRIKKINSNIEIITFFHNVERNFYKERIKAEGRSRLILLPSIIYNENLAVKYSDKIIMLNKRDINDLKKIYSKNELKNKKIYEIPIYIKDRFNLREKIKDCDYDYLFIGSAFYANTHGILWFIDNVLPYVKGKLMIIGKGMEILRNKYQNSNKLEILGTVDDIDKYYYENNIIISPIFYGAGMKTKTIEAMMFNKKIIGTTEAFVGIEEIEKIGFCCNSDLEFIDVLNNINFNKLNLNSREIYMKYFSYEINKEKLKRILEV